MEKVTDNANIDALANLSEADLLAALKAKKNKKKTDREAYNQLVADAVPKALMRLALASESLSNAKTETFQMFENILSLKNEVFGVKEGQQTHTFSTDRAEITIGYRVTDGWNDTVTAGIEKVRTFITSLAKDDNSAALVETVFNLLKRDSKGNLKGSRILELQKLVEKFDDPEFADGVDIISKAYKPVRSSWFIEAYIIDENGTKTSVPLSMSSAGFAGDYKFTHFTPKTEANGN